MNEDRLNETEDKWERGSDKRGGVEEGRRAQGMPREERTKKERTQANSFYPQSNLVYLDLIPNPLNTMGLHPLRAPHLHTSVNNACDK